MASPGADAATSLVPFSAAATEEDAVRAVRKRYESLTAVRSRAVKGKGAWYWTHLEPVVVHHPATGLPKAVKLRCSLCSSEFSASNPSRTASEHLKRRCCSNFSSTAPPAAIAAARPVSSLPPPSHWPLPPEPLAITEHSPPLVLSGGRDDLEALAMLEDSVKRIKSPGPPPCATLTREQAALAMTHFADWVYECCGGVSFASLDHPRLRAFLRHLGLPMLSCEEILGPRLAARYEDALRESDARTRDAPFFQIASDGWDPADGGLVAIALNLPNGTSVFRRAVFVDGKSPSRLFEEIICETIAGACAGDPRRCAGIVSGKLKLKALRELERRSPWMVNLPCQLRGVRSLLEDFARELPLFRSVLSRCKNIAHFFAADQRLCASFHSSLGDGRLTTDDSTTLIALMEEVMASARELHQIAIDDSRSGAATDATKAILDARFWNELEAALSLVKLTREMAMEIEAERPFVGQCLPMWEEFRSKVKGWCAHYNVGDGGTSSSSVADVVESRFRKNYHPAWAAAFVLDPLYLTKDPNGKYLPPFHCLTLEQATDAECLVARLVPPEEAGTVISELARWRSEGLERDYALAVQVRRRDPLTGRMRIANPLSSRLVWESHLREFTSLGKVAVRLIFLHATACGFRSNPSFLRWVGSHRRSAARLEKAQMVVFIAANERLKRGDFASEEEKDANLFCSDEDEEEEDQDHDDDEEEIHREEFMQSAPL